MKLEDLIECLQSEGETSGVNEELRTNMTQMVAWYYIRFRGRERGVDVEEFGNACVGYILAAYVANENTAKSIERDLERGKLDEEKAELAKNAIHVMMIQTIEKEVEDYMRENGDGRTLEEAGGENKVSFQEILEATREVMSEEEGETERAAEEAAYQRGDESLRPGEGKTMFQNMGYVQLILDLDTMNMGMMPLHVYQHKTGVEGDDGEEVCDYVYFVPRNERGIKDADEMKGEKPDFEFLNEDEEVGIQTISRYQDILYEGFTTMGKDEDDEDAKFVRRQVKMFEEAYYGCELLKRGRNVVSLFRLRNLYGGILDEDEALEEVMRAFKNLKGNVLLKMAEKGVDNKETYEMTDKLFDERTFEKAARVNLKKLLENVEKIDKRWF